MSKNFLLDGTQTADACRTPSKFDRLTFESVHPLLQKLSRSYLMNMSLIVFRSNPIAHHATTKRLC